MKTNMTAAIYGTNLTEETCEKLSIQIVNRKLFKGEAKLFESKWWDYRFLHPLSATYVFAYYYIDAIKTAISTRRDLYAGQHAEIFPELDLLENKPAVISGMWNARKSADKLGIRYDNYCRYGMDYALMCDWHLLPRPNQMYSPKVPENGTSSLRGYIELKWNDFVQVNNPEAKIDFYTLSEFSNHSYQHQYIRYILAFVANSNYKPGAVEHYVYNRKILSPNLIRKAFGKSADNWLEEAENSYLEQEKFYAQK